MNRALAETLTVLDRQRARVKWQQESCFSELSGVFSNQTSTHVHGFQGDLISDESVLDDLVMTRQVKPDPHLETSWPELGKVDMAGMGFGPCGYSNGPSFDMNYAISRTFSCPPAVAATIAKEATEVKGKESIVSENMGSAVARESSKKRKADKLHNLKVAADDDSKKTKACGEEGEESKITRPPNTNKSSTKQEPSADTSKENSKLTEVQKPDHIHVRVRREKISERMKYLQDLVPGCNKITGKAGMLDEIINYVQSLQRQVEFLSMKLAAVNPRLDFDIDNLFAKDVFPPCITNFPTVGISSEMANPSYLHFNPVQQVVACSGVEMGLNSPDIALRRTISAPESTILDASFLDTSCFTQIQPSPTWDVELQNVYNVAFEHGRSTTPFPSQPFAAAGSIEASHLKMEM
ncbi:hypothetical protein ES332_A12G030000v1 [Gossypium tomentosum]|uniref:BHLH domain-containing protein n=1 Tax=Gossypium tomentosum TaxID=34277 RepID=A0A5D2MRV0_GOSTO|nr:hypothetical protein ES332_A12G030000v1 [Gossypium tomentosum]